MAQQKTKTVILRDYFGYQEGQKPIDFLKELKQLSEKERLELAQGAAANMGLSADDVDFPLAAA